MTNKLTIEESVKKAGDKVKNQTKEESDQFFKDEIEKYKTKNGNHPEIKVLSGAEYLINRVLKEKTEKYGGLLDNLNT